MNFDQLPVKVNVLIRFWTDGGYQISMYDRGRLQPNDQAVPLRSVEDVLPKVSEIVNKIMPELMGGRSLAKERRSGDLFNLTVAFYKPVRGKIKNPRISFELYKGGNVSLESDPLIIKEFPGMDSAGELLLIPDDLARPLVISILTVVLWSCGHQKKAALVRNTGNNNAAN